MIETTILNIHPESTTEGSRFIGIDAGAETLKLVELLRSKSGWRVGRCEVIEHGKKPASALLNALSRIDWQTASKGAVTGRV
jgi:hypothetical protein